jgi:DNA-binding GntR family transcriptional regulator
MTKRREAIPPGQRIAADMRARLAAEEWTGNEVLPPGRELARHYGVTQTTIIRAMQQLGDEGLVHRVGRCWGMAPGAGPAGAESFDHAG